MAKYKKHSTAHIISECIIMPSHEHIMVFHESIKLLAYHCRQILILQFFAGKIT